jgi:hypothetical protein
MQVIKENRKVVSREITMTVPDDFINENIEITIRKIAGYPHKKKPGKSNFNAFRLSTGGFKFNREEAHKR